MSTDVSDPTTIDIEPTWTGMLSVLLEVLRNGDAPGRLLAERELERMAELADRYVDLRGQS